MREFKCIEGCTECCGPVPFTAEQWKKFKSKACEGAKIYTLGERLCAIDENMKCALLKDNRCAVYEDRPKLCKDFGLIEGMPCAFLKPNGNKRSEAMKKRIMRSHAKKFDETMRRIA